MPTPRAKQPQCDSGAEAQWGGEGAAEANQGDFTFPILGFSENPGLGGARAAATLASALRMMSLPKRAEPRARRGN